MKHSHRFFRNDACEYFPCHTGIDPKAFNCLFCFCPLYFLPDCGGDFALERGVKDCSTCTRPHEPGGYDRIIERLKRHIAGLRAGQG